MPEERVIAIGDIHGCFRTLKAMIGRLSRYPDLPLIFLGDYIDRGGYSREVVATLMELANERECLFLRGNHEQMLLDSVDGKDPEQLEMWYRNGGDRTLKSYGTTFNRLDLPEDHMAFFRETLFYYETEAYFFVHAGAPPWQTLAASVSDHRFRHNFLWTREHLGLHATVWEKTVIFGHTPAAEPIRQEGMIGIDTGCVYSSPGLGTLTALLLPEEEFIRQKSLDVWEA